jgi:hypothetical protein
MRLQARMEKTAVAAGERPIYLEGNKNCWQHHDNATNVKQSI